MYQPLSELFNDRQVEWTPSDMRMAAQEYLRKLCRTEQVYCDDFIDGTVYVRVGSPLLADLVLLHVYDLTEHLSEHTALVAKRCTVSIQLA